MQNVCTANEHEESDALSCNLAGQQVVEGSLGCQHQEGCGERSGGGFWRDLLKGVAVGPIFFPVFLRS